MLLPISSWHDTCLLNPAIAFGVWNACDQKRLKQVLLEVFKFRAFWLACYFMQLRHSAWRAGCIWQVILQMQLMIDYFVDWSDKKLTYRRGAAGYTLPSDILTTAAQLYEKIPWSEKACNSWVTLKLTVGRQNWRYMICHILFPITAV